jgi:hypothetical protein
MRQGNLSSSRVRWRDGSPMAAFDRLPPELRRWLHDAALPWSPRSAARIYARARAEGADPQAALARLTAAERATLAREDYRRGP